MILLAAFGHDLMQLGGATCSEVTVGYRPEAPRSKCKNSCYGTVPSTLRSCCEKTSCRRLRDTLEWNYSLIERDSNEKVADASPRSVIQMTSCICY